MNRIKIIILLATIVLTLNACLTVAAAGAGAAGGYYCGSTGKCTR